VRKKNKKKHTKLNSSTQLKLSNEKNKNLYFFILKLLNELLRLQATSHQNEQSSIDRSLLNSTTTITAAAAAVFVGFDRYEKIPDLFF